MTSNNQKKPFADSLQWKIRVLEATIWFFIKKLFPKKHDKVSITIEHQGMNTKTFVKYDQEHPYEEIKFQNQDCTNIEQADIEEVSSFIEELITDLEKLFSTEQGRKVFMEEIIDSLRLKNDTEEKSHRNNTIYDPTFLPTHNYAYVEFGNHSIYDYPKNNASIYDYPKNNRPVLSSDDYEEIEIKAVQSKLNDAITIQVGVRDKSI